MSVNETPAQDPASPPLTEQVSVVPSSAESEIAAEVDLVRPVGAPEICGASGAAVSTDHETDSAELVLPAASVAFTATLCGPSDRPERVIGELQAE